MIWLQETFRFIIETLLQEIVVVIAGVLFAQFIYVWWVKYRYGGWRVIVWKREEEKLDREISPGKLKEIKEEPAELAVFLKGVASPYAWINCDLIKDGEALGLLVIDPEKKTYTLNLDKNPKPEPRPIDEVTQQFAQEIMRMIGKTQTIITQ